MIESPLPTFAPGLDPGSSFVDLLRRVAPHDLPGAGLEHTAGGTPLEVTHGTTVVAIRFAGGVVMAGDRRATAGYTIASRRIEKVFAADDYSGVAIAGAAGPAVEMVKLFQVQLEHYEKIEGETLSLEGKANQLGQMVRSNLPAAMQGFAVVPLFAGYDHRRDRGRVFSYDVTGGKYEEADFQTNGSGGVHARNWIKATWSEGMARDDAIDLSLAVAVRGGRRGHRHRRARPHPAHLPDRGGDLLRRLHTSRRGRDRDPRRVALRRPRRGERAVSMPFYVPPEQMMKDRADYARKGIARGRSLVAFSVVDGIVLVAENAFRTLYKISEIYDRIAFAGVGKYNEFEMLRVAGVRQADLKGYSFAREDVNARALANAYGQTLGQVFTHEMKPYEVEILVAQVGESVEDDELYHILYDGTVMDEEGSAVLGGQAEEIADALESRFNTGLDRAAAIRLGAAVLAGPETLLTADQLEVAFLDRTRSRRAFRRIKGGELIAILDAAD